jgi:hypothetical protein
MFIFSRQKLFHSKAQIVLGGVLVLVVSLLFAFIFNSPVSAAMDTNTKPSDRAKSYSYWKASNKCVADHMRSEITTSTSDGRATTPNQGGLGAGGNEWFNDIEAFVVVYPDGQLDCNQVLIKAMDLWGLGSGATLLSDMGYTFDANNSKWRRNNDSGESRSEAYRNVVLRKVGNVVNLLNNEAKHSLYFGMFTSTNSRIGACQAKRVGLLSEVNEVQRAAAQNNQFRDGVTYTVVKVGEGTTARDYVYTYNASGNAGETTTGATLNTYASAWNYRGVNAPGGQGEVYSCKDLVKMISDTAGDFARWNRDHEDVPDTLNPGGTSGSNTCIEDASSCETTSTCVVEGMGWLICPTLNFLSVIVDNAYNFVSELLKVQPLIVSGENTGVYGAWSVMRNIANVAFVIVFLLIIFSQLTSVGVSNYGVKKLLPRLIIAAILVNVSFWICAIAVDLSNILGASMRAAFDAVGTGIRVDIDLDGGTTGEGWEWMTGVVLAGAAGAALYVGLSALLPALIAVFLAIVTVLIVLVFRQALIILLIVIAPLAFVAYILPNTEGWFTRWRKLLMTLLLMYPIIAAIFGASALASEVVMQGAQEGDSPYKIAIQIMGASIAILPLAITPVVMRTAGGLLNRFGGIVNNREKGPADRLKRLSEGYNKSRTNLRNAKALNGDNQFGRGAFVRWRARRGAIAGGRESEANRARTEYVADQIQSNDGFQNSVAAGTRVSNASSEAKQRALASAISTNAKLEADEISAAQVVIKSAQLTRDQLRDLTEGRPATGVNGIKLEGGSTAMKAAAIKAVVESNDVKQINKLYNESMGWYDNDNQKNNQEFAKLRNTFADSLQSSSARPAYYGQGAIASLRQADITQRAAFSSAERVIESALGNNTYSPDKIVAADKDELAAVDEVRRSTTNLSHEAHQKFVENVTVALDDQRLNVRIGKNRENIEKIRSNTPLNPLT